MTKKILCATDGEPHSDIPVARATEMAAELGAKLSIIAVNIRGTDGLSSATRPLYERVREIVPYLDHDVTITDYVEALAGALLGGSLTDGPISAL